MPDFPAALSTFLDFVQVVIGFSLIIIIHELGHFVAARWAGVRVLAFAVGFGPAICSYRRGLGFRRGSSEQEREAKPSGSSPTEYRLNWLPLGGYVKMLGQDDADPTATSDEPDSYQNCPVWKRMVVISAGVVFNIITAAILFIIVFMVGLKTPPPRIGQVVRDQPAAEAVALNADEAGVTEPGLQPGDTVLSIDGQNAEEFTDIVVAAAMAAPDEPVRLEVQRPGVGERLIFSISPERDEATRLLDIGVGPPRSTQLQGARLGETGRGNVREILAEAGASEVEPGMRLVSVEGRKAASPFDLSLAVAESGGEPVSASFEGDGGRTVEVTVQPKPEVQLARFRKSEREEYPPVSHLLGLPPLLRVHSVQSEAPAKAGLRAGDLFSRLGPTEWPVAATAVAEIKRQAGKTIQAEVMRQTEDGWIAVPLELQVQRNGTIGFLFSESDAAASFVGAWPDLPLVDKQDDWQLLRPAQQLGDMRGRRILAVNGQPVESLVHLREVLKAQTAGALASGAESVTLALRVERPAEPRRVALEVPWTLQRPAIELLHDEERLGWENPLPLDLFEPDEITLKAEGPAGAVAMGLRRTHRVMTMTYLTFVRLFQGSVRVEHLKGPVGIAHVGTVIADKGFIWLLFFMALISVNLAVINFLPIPIADGGHFVFLVYEQITGRPPPVAVQNAAAIAGLVLIASVFLVVTFNDIRNLF